MSFVTGKRGPVRPDSRNVVRGHETRRRILDAARARILADGFDALRLDVLARDVGVTKAAVIKSIGGKATILLSLGDEDRQTRLDAIRQTMKLRTGIERRLAHITRLWYELDIARLNVVMPYVGFMWFWSGADHDRAAAMVEETRALIGELLAVVNPKAVLFLGMCGAVHPSLKVGDFILPIASIRAERSSARSKPSSGHTRNARMRSSTRLWRMTPRRWKACL